MSQILSTKTHVVELVERLTVASKVKIGRLGLDVSSCEALDEFYHHEYSMKFRREGMEWTDAKPDRPLRSLHDVLLTRRFRHQVSREVREIEALSPEKHLLLLMFGDGDQFMPPLTLPQPLLTPEQQHEAEQRSTHHAAFRPSNHLAIEALKDGLCCEGMLHYRRGANLDRFKNFQVRVKSRKERAAATIKRVCDAFIKRMKPGKGGAIPRAWALMRRMVISRMKRAAAVIKRSCAIFIQRVEPQWKAGVIVRAYVVFMRSRRAKLAREKRATAVIKRSCADFIKRVEPQWKGRVLFRAYQIFMQMRKDTLAAQELWTRIVRQRSP